MDESHTPIYQFKVTLAEIDPPVWRRIQVYRHKSFLHLHLALQAAMGWLNYHLHLFEVDDVTITDRTILDEWGEEQGVDHEEARLMDYVGQVGTRFTYEYDFGDSWVHELLLEEKLPLQPDARYPRCLDGARACPPEDVGGFWGYERFLEAIGDPSDPEHQEYLQWVGGSFDPQAFSVEEVNRRYREGYTWGEYTVVPPLATRPHFSGPAEKHWLAVPEEARQRILQNAWCAHCRRETTLVDFQGRIERGDLLLEGHCAACGGRVARLLEGG